MRDLYEQYISSFDARDAAAFAGFFHLPVTIFSLPWQPNAALSRG